MKKYLLSFVVLLLLLTTKNFAIASSHSGMYAKPDSLIHEAAPDFQLTGIDGNVVSLKDFAGKIVVIDFWATWCVPCKMSFPGMQLAVNKYQNDPDVKFIFIDIKERSDNFKEDVIKLMTDNHYSFNVLIDADGPEGKQCKLYKELKFKGIPARVIIDKNGFVRVKEMGNDPNNSSEQGASALAKLIEEVRSNP